MIRVCPYFLVRPLLVHDFFDFLFFLVLLPPYFGLAGEPNGELNSETGSEPNEFPLGNKACCCDKGAVVCDKVAVGCDGCDNLLLLLLLELEFARLDIFNLGRIAEGLRSVGGSCGGAPIKEGDEG